MDGLPQVELFQRLFQENILLVESHPRTKYISRLKVEGRSGTEILIQDLMTKVFKSVNYRLSQKLSTQHSLRCYFRNSDLTLQYRQAKPVTHRVCLYVRGYI